MQDVLTHFGITDTEFLGEGGEVRAYRLGTTRVLRIYKKHGSAAGLEKLQKFYAGLDTGLVTFAVPEICELGVYNGYPYSIDVYMRGREFGKKLGELNGEARSKALESFWSVAQQIRRLSAGYHRFGQILNTQPIQTKSWPGFLRQKVTADFAKTRRELIADVPDIDDIAEFFLAACSLVDEVTEKTLIHGDFFPPNVFINESNEICGVADFNTLALAGDPRMDIAGAIIFLEVTDDATQADGDFLLRKAVEQYGAGILDVINLYRLYYSFVFSDCKMNDPKTYEWCLDNFRKHQSRR